MESQATHIPAGQAGTRAVLMGEAERLIRRRGYAGFSYADLASVVGIRKASIHHHFPTKEALALAVLAAYRARYAEALAQIEAASPHALERVEAYGRLYLSGVEQGLGCLCAALAAELDAVPESLQQGAARFFSAHLQWLETIYAQGLHHRQVNPHLAPAEAARLVLSTLEGALMMERMLAGPEGFAQVLRALCLSLRAPH